MDELLEQRVILNYKEVLIDLADIAFNAKTNFLDERKLKDIRVDIIRMEEDEVPQYIMKSMKKRYDKINNVLKLVEEGDYKKAYKNSMKLLKKSITFHKTYFFEF